MTPEEPIPPARDDGQPERFLEAVAAPLAKNAEHQHAAKNVMRAMVVEAGALDDATRRMESQAFKWKRWLFPLLGFALVMAITIPSLWQMVKLIYAQETQFSRQYASHRRPAIPLIKPDVWQSSRLTAEEKLILLGDDDASTEVERLKAIVDHFPNRPEFYAEYAEHLVLANRKLPDDFDEVVARIDPENGYFSYLKALETGKGSFDSGTGRGSSVRFHIRDLGKLQEANQWIHRAANAKEFRSYKNELRAQRARLMPPREDFVTACLFGIVNQSAFWRYGESLETEGFHPIAELSSLHTAGQEEKFRSLLDDHRKFQHRMIGEKPTSLHWLYAPSKVAGCISIAAEVSDKLKLEPERTRFKELDDWVKKNPPGFLARSRASRSPASERMIERASTLIRSYAFYSNLIPDDQLPSDEALAPGRLAEHAVWGRMASLMMVGLLAALAWIMLLYRFRHGRLPRLVTHSLKRTLRPTDYLWILLLGVGLPLLWHQTVRQSSWGGLDFNLQHGFEKLISPQWGLLAFLVLMATTIAARWRVKRRLRGIDLGIGRSAFTWICLLLTAATMPLMNYWIENPSLPDESMLLAGAVPSLWFVVSLTRGLFMPTKSNFGQLLVSRVTATSWLLASVIFAACAPVYYQVERYWVARDPLLQSPDFPNALENKIVAEMNREDLELLDRMKVEE